MNRGVFLIATVGGSEKPIVASLLKWKPLRAYFAASAESRERVDAIVAMARADGFDALDKGRWHIIDIKDAQDISQTLLDLQRWWVTLREGLPDDVILVCDITGGTKPMSSALALSASRWECTLSYVGGEERTEDGVGVVVDGKEKFIFHELHPWIELGFAASEEALTLLRNNAFGAAAAILDEAKKRQKERFRKDALHQLQTLAEGLRFWDVFDHKRALEKLQGIEVEYVRSGVGLDVSRALGGMVEHVKRLQYETQPSRELILDLVGNANRRMAELRWDDATARLYRAVEATGQLRLRQLKGWDTAEVPLAELPADLAEAWGPRANSSTTIKIALDDTWTLIERFDPVLGAKYRSIFPARVNVLSARNMSILAHGFQPVSEKTTRQLFRNVLELLGTGEEDLPSFRLPEATSGR